MQTVVGASLEFASVAAWSPNNDLLAVVYCQTSDFGCAPDDRAELRLFDPASGLNTPLLADVDLDSQVEWLK